MMIVSGKADGHHVVAAFFADAPKNDYRRSDKHGLAAEVGDQRHELVEKRSSNALKSVKQFHKAPLVLVKERLFVQTL